MDNGNTYLGYLWSGGGLCLVGVIRCICLRTGMIEHVCNVSFMPAIPTAQVQRCVKAYGRLVLSTIISAEKLWP